MWLTGATLSAGSGLVIIVLVIIHALHAEYADGLRADATGTAGGVSPDGVPSTTGMLIGAALIAVGLSVMLVVHLTGSPRGRQAADPAG